MKETIPDDLASKLRVITLTMDVAISRTNYHASAVFNIKLGMYYYIFMQTHSMTMNGKVLVPHFCYQKFCIIPEIWQLI